MPYCRRRTPTLGPVTTSDGAEIFSKDWGSGQPIALSHDWPLGADDGDSQMLVFVEHVYRAIAHDHRGHGRSTQISDGHDMDHDADDLAELTAHLDLHDAIEVGHSSGGGEVVHSIARHREHRVAKAVLLSSVRPSTMQTDANPVDCPRVSSTIAGPGCRPTDPSSPGPCLLVPFSDSTGPTGNPQKPSSKPGGARE